MYICIDKKREVRLKRIFYSFTVVGIFKVFCEKTFSCLFYYYRYVH